MLILMLHLFIFSINSFAQLVEDKTPALTYQGKIDSVKLSKGACFGRCPVFEVTFYRDGSAKYVGKKFVKLIGNYVIPAHSERTTLLLQWVDTQLELFRAVSTSACKVSTIDAPTTSISIKTSNGESERACQETLPPVIWGISNALSNEVEKPGWAKEK